MDYGRFIQAHRETDADITVAALPMDEKRSTGFGLMKIDEECRIIEFAEKPKGEQLKAMKVDTTILGPDDERAKEMPYIASMGIYVVSKDVMLNLLRDKFPGARGRTGQRVQSSPAFVCKKGLRTISLTRLIVRYMWDCAIPGVGMGQLVPGLSLIRLLSKRTWDKTELPLIQSFVWSKTNSYTIYSGPSSSTASRVQSCPEAISPETPCSVRQTNEA
ncbi:ADP glucose pyrophosphorylase 1 [Actinidia rufa]|uniref:glucose-1-phosphate adenylyltransferase n=1 Tax=Actinidia rufa TaxID=165716 RepID=A0A7J0FG78_9ERIC|nr:ADP glucose pyrophosphorylase 1 [Actinidia rufa]